MPGRSAAIFAARWARSPVPAAKIAALHPGPDCGKGIGALACRVHPLLWLRYLLGQADAIREVASTRAALWTGIALVLVTSIPRNYDQTLLAEKPFLWIFGALLFSLVSGTWIYCVVFEIFARPKHFGLEQPKWAFNSRWLCFMGLFWMTAPVAWLYAIPVERFLDSVSAARANVALLALVSLWRVLLMARVLQVTTRAPFLMTLWWVVFAAALETMVLVFFGGTFAKRIMAGMGGMRNSPEEEILMSAMSMAFSWALFLAPLALVVSMAWRPRRLLQPLPCPVAGRVSWISLLVVAAIWIGLAIKPQRELANNVVVERLMSLGQTRAALDYLAARQPEDFAPARPLPPKPFELEIFTELPACFSVVQTNDPPWVHRQLIVKLDAMMTHMRHWWKRAPDDSAMPHAQRVRGIINASRPLSPKAEGLRQILEGLARLPDGRTWLATNTSFVEVMIEAVRTPDVQTYYRSQSESEQMSDWLVLSNYLSLHFTTNGVLRSAVTTSSPAP
jgi:hypothetical protein